MTLLLGLGGGGMVHYLRQRHPRLQLSAIEIAAEVIDIAKYYFQCREETLTHIIHDDAKIFLEKSTQQYDCILCDIYSSQEYPRHCFTRDFFQLCLNRLAENGSFSINCIADKLGHSHRLIGMIRQVFESQTLIIPVEGQSNIVIHAFKQRGGLNALINTSNALKKVIWDAKWGMIAEL